MTDNRDIIRGYSKDRRIYRRENISDKANSSPKLNLTSENYYSNRNCPEILSSFDLTNRNSDERGKRIYHSITSDTHHFSMVNYPIQSSPSAPTISNLALNNKNKQDKEPMFPKLTPRSTAAVKTFPNLIPRSIPSNSDSKGPIPTMRTSLHLQPISSSLKEPSQTKMPIVPREKKKKIQLSRLE